MICGVQKSMEHRTFKAMSQEINAALNRDSVSKLVQIIEKYFEDHGYTLWHLFKEEQHRILDKLLLIDMREIESSFREIIERNSGIMSFLSKIQIPIPKPLAVTAAFILNADLLGELEAPEPDLDRLDHLIEEAKGWSVRLDTDAISFVASECIGRMMERAVEEPENISLFEGMERLFGLLKELQLDLNLWKPQNMYYALSRDVLPAMVDRAEKGDASAESWTEAFRKLSEHLRVEVG